MFTGSFLEQRLFATLQRCKNSRETLVMPGGIQVYPLRPVYNKPVQSSAILNRYDYVGHAINGSITSNEQHKIDRLRCVSLARVAGSLCITRNIAPTARTVSLPLHLSKPEQAHKRGQALVWYRLDCDLRGHHGV